ncbi:MAG: metallophosphoesterase [Planctomycetota bacterium]|nr:metallophosphoesterase [Planctomycetota bacterium]
MMFTEGPERLSRGRISRRLLSGNILVREVETESPRWPEALDGLRIGHVSDFHLGALIPLRRALEAVDALAGQKPDFVACTGDVVDLHHDPARPLLEAMGSIGAPLGAALVLGNHDELHCPDTIMRLGREAGLIVLHDEAVRLSRNGDALLVAGIGWSGSAAGCAERIERAGGSDAHLLLSHNPRAFLSAGKLGVPLTLAGHTHGGHIALRRRPGTNLALTHRYRSGLYAVGPSRLYVTTGVGDWFPVRINCPSEIAIITMRHGEGPADAETGRAGRARQRRRMGPRSRRRARRTGSSGPGA